MPVRKKSGDLLNVPRIFIYIYIYWSIIIVGGVFANDLGDWVQFQIESYQNF